MPPKTQSGLFGPPTNGRSVLFFNSLIIFFTEMSVPTCHRREHRCATGYLGGGEREVLSNFLQNPKISPKFDACAWSVGLKPTFIHEKRKCFLLHKTCQIWS